jgi:hypothetical protein
MISSFGIHRIWRKEPLTKCSISEGKGEQKNMYDKLELNLLIW